MLSLAAQIKLLKAANDDLREQMATSTEWAVYQAPNVTIFVEKREDDYFTIIRKKIRAGRPTTYAYWTGVSWGNCPADYPTLAAAIHVARTLYGWD